MCSVSSLHVTSYPGHLQEELFNEQPEYQATFHGKHKETLQKDLVVISILGPNASNTASTRCTTHIALISLTFHNFWASNYIPIARLEKLHLAYLKLELFIGIYPCLVALDCFVMYVMKFSVLYLRHSQLRNSNFKISSKTSTTGVKLFVLQQQRRQVDHFLNLKFLSNRWFNSLHITGQSCSLDST